MGNVLTLCPPLTISEAELDAAVDIVVEEVARVAAATHIQKVARSAIGREAVRMLTAPWSFSLSARRITISTVGLPAQMRRLADEDLPVTLALSLHAPTDELRRQLIPWSQYVSIDQLLAAAQDYFHKTGREVTLEYTLMRDVNDRPEHAEALARLARVLRCHINLIRYNEVRGLPFARPATDNVHQFQAILRQASINTHIRASRGRNIAAACGQLRTEVGNPS